MLRKAEGKEYAEIYDFITIPRSLDSVQYCNEQELKLEVSLVKKEIDRMMDFAETLEIHGILITLKKSCSKHIKFIQFRKEKLIMSNTNQTNEKFEIDTIKLNRMMMRILRIERNNILTNTLSDTQMIDLIRQIIIEEAKKCY